MARPSLMLLGGEHRNALGIVRRLGRAGIPVSIGGSHRLARACFSRYASQCFFYPSPEDDIEAAHVAVMTHIERLRPDVLLPAMDDGWKLVYDFYDIYEKHTTVVPCPGAELFKALSDKSTMTTRAQQHGIPTPQTIQPPSLEEARDLSGGLPYPVLLKPVNSVAGAGIRIAQTPNAFATALANYHEVPLIQEFIPGEDLELTLLFYHGEPLAGSVYLSLRNYPLPYGPPIACRTIQDDDLMHTGIQFLRGLHYHGVAHLDFRRDQRDGVAKLLDFNVRLAGTDELSARGGIDFPLMLFQLALGEQVQPRFVHDTELEFRWVLFGEIEHFLRAPHKRQVARDLLRWRGVQTNIALLDPLPHIAHLLSAFRSG